MKKLGLCILLLLVLSGCGETEKEIDRGMKLRQQLLGANGFSFEAEITADYGEKLHCFSMQCQTDKDGKISFRVTAPETIAGISGTIDEEGGALTFDEQALYFDLLTDDQLSPVSAPWILVRTLRSGYLTSACQEEAGLHLTMDDSYEENSLTLDIWLDDQDMPKRAEILYNGRRILTLLITNAALV